MSAAQNALQDRAEAILAKLWAARRDLHGGYPSDYTFADVNGVPSVIVASIDFDGAPSLEISSIEAFIENYVDCFGDEADE